MSLSQTYIRFKNAAGSPLILNGAEVRPLSLSPSVIARLTRMRERTEWNYYFCPPTLSRYGEGHFLVDMASAAAIVAESKSNPTAPIYVEFFDQPVGVATPRSVTIPVHVVGVRKVLRQDDRPSTPDANRKILCDVHVADERWALQYQPCDTSAYWNVTDHSGSSVYTKSLNSGSEWTFLQVMNALWSDYCSLGNFAGYQVELPAGMTPPPNPVDVIGEGRLACNILDDLADQLGLFFVFRPNYDLADTTKYGPSLVTMNDAIYSGWLANETRVTAESRTFSGDIGLRNSTIVGDFNRLPAAIPGNVRVHFPTRWDSGTADVSASSSTAQPVNQWVSKTVSDPSAYLSPGEYSPFLTLPVYDTQPAIVSATGTVTNDAVLVERSQYVANQTWNSLKYRAVGRRVDRGIYDLKPDGMIQQITWQLSSDGMYTIVNAFEDTPAYSPPWMRKPGNRFYGLGGVQCVQQGASIAVFGAGGSGSSSNAFLALLTGWQKFDPDDLSNPLYAFSWKEAYLDDSGVAQELSSGRNSGTKGGYVLNIAHDSSSGTVSHDYEPTPGNGEAFDGTGDPTDLELGYTHHPTYDGTTYIAVGTTLGGTDLGVYSEASNPQTLADLPADGSTFYIVISEGIAGGSDYTEEYYECSITVTANTYAPAINLDDINRVAAFALRTPAGGGVEAVGDTDATPMDPVCVWLSPISLVAGLQSGSTLASSAEGQSSTIYSFEWPAAEYHGVIVGVEDAGVETDYTDERYYVRRAKVSNATPDNAFDDVVELTALTGDDAELVTVTNLAEAVDHTHGLPVGTPVIYYGVRGGDLPHRPRYVMQAGGGGAITLGETSYQPFVVSVSWNDTTCTLDGVKKWFELVEATIAGAEYLLITAIHDTDPT